MALKEHRIGVARRIAREHISVISGEVIEGLFSLDTPIGRLRDDQRSDCSPSEDLAPVVFLQRLNNNLF